MHYVEQSEQKLAKTSFWPKKEIYQISWAIQTANESSDGNNFSNDIDLVDDSA